MTEPILRAEGIAKRYGGVDALIDTHLALAPGEHAALVGDNGAGKSTFVKILTGAEQPDAGRVFFAGQEVRFRSPLDARRAGIETVYQTLALADHLDVTSNLFLGRERYRLRLGPFSILNHGAMKSEARRMLSGTGVRITDLGAPVMGMSGGQRQGVAIARAAGWGSKL
ncbi:MAG: sugar ABC transporter ATP-binding protein, partial [Pseudonocardia sp.]|nr:sugar ABC transporter ATP-binding protein [Pseudonocardia sp.]